MSTSPIKRPRFSLLPDSLVLRLTVAATLSTLVAIGVSGRISYDSASELLIEDAMASMEASVTRQAERLAAAMEGVRSDASALSRSQPVHGLLESMRQAGFDQYEHRSTKDWKRQVERSFEVLSESKGYWQVRLIDLSDNGKEIVRVQMNTDTGTISAIGSDDLQHKGDAAYVLAGQKLGPDQVFTSTITLNREFGEITQPEVPTQRFVTAIYQSHIDSDWEINRHLGQLAVRIGHLDEALTNAAISATRSHDKSWRLKYNHFADQLDACLLEVSREGTPSQAKQVQSLSDNNSALIEMEERSFALVAENQASKARRILTSPLYLGHKASYAKILTALTQSLGGVNEDSDPVAIIVINTLASPFIDHCLDLDMQGELIIANESGGFIRHPNPDLVWEFERSPHKRMADTDPHLWDMISDPDGASRHDESGSIIHVRSRVHMNPGLDDSHLTVIATVDRSHVLAKVLGLRAHLIQIALIIMLSAALITWLLLRRTTEPIRRLMHNASRICEGETDVTFDVRGRDEIAQLGKVFAILIEELQAETSRSNEHTEELNALNSSLEDQVQLRTAKLSDSEARLSAIMDNAGEAFITVDDAGVILHWNVAASLMFGIQQSDAIGSGLKRIVPSGSANKYGVGFGCFKECAGAFGHHAPFEVQAQRADGSCFPAQVTLSSAPTERGELIIGLVRDLTEERTLQSQLEQARKLESIGSLAAGVAHEINTPTQYATDNVRFLETACQDLLTLTGQTLLAIDNAEAGSPIDIVALRKKTEDADLEFLVEEVPKAIEQSLQGLGRIATIVKAMKEFSHPGSGTKDPLDLNKLIRTTATVGAHEWKYCAELEVDSPADLPLVPCFGADLSQVLLNLIVNASHAIESRQATEDSQTKGKILLKVVRLDERVEIRVSDTGSGMPEDIRKRIFDPFFTTKEVGKGTGQGLAIAHAIIVDKHGGTIKVESEIGHGTTFILQIPVEAESSADAA